MYSVSRKCFISQVALLAIGSMSRVSAAPAIEMVSLVYIARLYSMRISTISKKIVLENKYNRIEVENDSRRVWVNGVLVWLHQPCRKTSKGWEISDVDFKKGIDPILRSYAYAPARRPVVVVLDPGHGGRDSGAVGKRKVYEKLAVLSIANRVKAHLEAKGVRVQLTRSDDTYLTLTQRSQFAEKANADLFVSIHADAAESPAAHGVETFVMTVAGYDSTNEYGKSANKASGPANTHDAANAILGFSIQSNLIKNSKRSDRGLRRARWTVLKNAPCPAALVECGFLSNPEEEELMISAGYREAVARGISNGILGYITQVKRVRK